MPSSALAGAVATLGASVEGSEIFGCDFVELFEEVSGVSEIIVFSISILDNMRILCWHASINLDVTLAKVLNPNSIKGQSLDTRVRGLVTLG